MQTVWCAKQVGRLLVCVFEQEVLLSGIPRQESGSTSIQFFLSGNLSIKMPNVFHLCSLLLPGGCWQERFCCLRLLRPKWIAKGALLTQLG